MYYTFPRTLLEIAKRNTIKHYTHMGLKVPVVNEAQYFKAFTLRKYCWCVMYQIIELQVDLSRDINILV